MEEEILKLIYNYSVNKKYVDQEFYNTILVLFLKHRKVNNYINTIIINNNITDLGIYDNKRKTIIINNLEILNSSDDKIELLSLRDIDEYFLIKLLPKVLEHLEETNKEFDSYMNKLSKYDEEYIINYWIYLLYIELMSNQKIESLIQDEKKLGDKRIFFNTLGINHKRIHNLHNFVTEGEMEPTYTYRSTEATVGRKNPDGSINIFWRGAQAKDVNKFMSDFLNIYKQGGASLIYSNPFLASSIIHLLFLRIHPYTDGNGRTARILHNIKFTEMINKVYSTRLKLSPLNISESILINKITYV